MFNKSRIALITLTLLACQAEAGWLKGRDATPAQTAVAPRQGIAAPRAEVDQTYLQQTDALIQARLDETLEAKQDPLMSNFEGTPAEAAAKFKALLDKAEQGDLAAQVLVGWAYQHGKGIAQSYKAAAFWYTQASDKGSLQGSLAMGHLMANGRMTKALAGGNGDTAEIRALDAQKWSLRERAAYAETDSPTAMSMAHHGALPTVLQLREAALHPYGGPDVSLARAAFWFLRAADAGDLSAQLWAGWYFAKDILDGDHDSANRDVKSLTFSQLSGQLRREIRGVLVGPTNAECGVLALKYYTLAAKQGNQRAADWIKQHNLDWSDRQDSMWRNAWNIGGSEPGEAALGVRSVKPWVDAAMKQDSLD